MDEERYDFGEARDLDVWTLDFRFGESSEQISFRMDTEETHCFEEMQPCSVSGASAP